MTLLDGSLSAANIQATALRIAPHIRRTPVVFADGADFGLAGVRLALKLEMTQHAGSFKSRGVFNHLLSRALPAAGVVAASGGNHGAAVSFAAGRLNVPAHIFVPRVASPAKIEQITAYGAHLEVGGERYADALEASERFAQSNGAMTIHAFDQVETLLGQASVALEFEEQVPGLDALLVAVGGGIAADSLAPRRVGQLVFPIAQRYVHSTVLVTDDAIRAAQAALWRVLRVVVEPGGAAAFAALQSGAWVPARSSTVGVLLCGANTTAVRFE